MSSLYRGLNTYIFFKLKECLASLSANSFPSIPTWLGIHKLNSYLNKIGCNSSNLCDTCQQDETVEHFLLHCKLYDTYRKTMIDQLLQLGVTNFNLTILLSGKNVQPVADYINQTNRF
jgi:hypothetical protein